MTVGEVSLASYHCNGFDYHLSIFVDKSITWDDNSRTFYERYIDKFALVIWP